MSKRVLLRLVATLAAGLVVLSVLALPARAGGPTSVLIVNASTGQTGALYYTDADYDALAAAVGWYGGDNTADSTGASHAEDMATMPPQEGSFGSEVRLTWLIHDMSIWRIDRIHLDADGGWLVQTLVDLDGGNPDSATPVWHRPAEPTRLQALLTSAGVIGKGTVKPATPLSPADSSAAAPAAVATPLTWWPTVAAGLVGLVLGVGGTLLLGRARRRPGPPSTPLPESERVVLTG